MRRVRPDLAVARGTKTHSPQPMPLPEGPLKNSPHSLNSLSNSVELLIAVRSNRIHYIYLSVLLLIVGLLVALPLVSVTVSVAASGMVRPVLEKQVLRSRANAFIHEVRVANNQTVKIGDTLVVLDDTQQRGKKRVLQEQIAERQNLVRDFESLSAGASNTLDSVRARTTVGQAEAARFIAERRRLHLTGGEAIRQRELARTLARTPGIVTTDEMKRRENDAAQAESEISLQKERAIADWSGRLRNEHDNIRDLVTQLSDLERQRNLFVILSPVNGTAEQVASMSPGGFVQTGDELFQISPDAKIAAEIQVSARDVGMLAIGMSARMMIDAFDYNSWGVATGQIVSISRDATVIEHQAIYAVRCSIDQTSLSLKNGYRGKIQKGMSLRARFLVVKRSLFSLLYDRVDSWLNPNLVTDQRSPTRFSEPNPSEPMTRRALATTVTYGSDRIRRPGSNRRRPA